ncbi:lytic murein transglycosylase B [Anaerobiospirillum sp. NML120449]|uniref:lytic murein transglycosylase B n=1 Tax=Anaerobiospirillum sp. NML120449 TaxID=2932817 RepID=UPI001FF49FF7|nr:lytic murein transglycosylase B [Anaerobiospirillum sp. NML120449]MCK0526539.1 lytic murein transglycosylase B [Anaerobiospirillum sp. NML120449]
MRLSSSLSKTALSLSLGVGLAFGAFNCTAVQAADNGPDLNELARYASIDRALLDSAITQATYQQKIIDTMNRPYEGKPWHQYRKLFITDKRINGGIDFYLKHEAELQRAQTELGVAPEIICAIIGVETFYGANMGTWKVLDALYTLGFHYPKRSAYFSKEFANYVKLATREGWVLTDTLGSYAGAMGMGQFMPSSYLNFAIDFDGDQHVNLFNNTLDAIGSVANYFKGHGWIYGAGVVYPAHLKGIKGKPVSKATIDQLMKKEWNLKPADLTRAGITTKVALSADQNVRLFSFELENGSFEYMVGLNNFNTITRYNKSPLYARAVFELSEAIAAGYQEAKLLQGQYVGKGGRNP